MTTTTQLPTKTKDILLLLLAGQNQLQQDVSGIKGDIVGMKQDISVLKQDVSVLKQDVSVLKQDVSILKADVKDIRNDLNQFKKDVAFHFEQTTDLILEIRDELIRRLRVVETRVGITHRT